MAFLEFRKNLQCIFKCCCHRATRSIPISYSVGAKLSFGDMSAYEYESEYFIYEADEYDRNFLAFKPHMSVITGIDWNHPDTYPTRESYSGSFRQFLQQSMHIMLWESDKKQLNIQTNDNITILEDEDQQLRVFSLAGEVNRRSTYQTVRTVNLFINISLETFIMHTNGFPVYHGVLRRSRQIYTPTMLILYQKFEEHYNSLMKSKSKTSLLYMKGCTTVDNML